MINKPSYVKEAIAIAVGVKVEVVAIIVAGVALS